MKSTEKYGETTDLRTLPNGTKFYVVNGGWTGYVYEENGKKYMHIDGDNIRKIELTGREDLVINIRKVKS